MFRLIEKLRQASTEDQQKVQKFVALVLSAIAVYFVFYGYIEKFTGETLPVDVSTTTVKNKSYFENLSETLSKLKN